jgi:hypothetical protein
MCNGESNGCCLLSRRTLDIRLYIIRRRERATCPNCVEEQIETFFCLVKHECRILRSVGERMQQ